LIPAAAQCDRPRHANAGCAVDLARDPSRSLSRGGAAHDAACADRLMEQSSSRISTPTT
jgi:phosphohistidine phosphatase SixA